MIVGCGVAADRAGQVTTEEAMAVWLRHIRDSRDLGLAWSQREAGHRVKGEKLATVQVAIRNGVVNSAVQTAVAQGSWQRTVLRQPHTSPRVQAGQKV